MKWQYVLYGFLWLAGCTTPKEDKSPPNILIMLADDLGYADLHSYGGVAHTPHLDKLAAEGLKFNYCYASAPNCSPSRVGLLTGRIPARAGMYSYRPGGGHHPMHLQDDEVTIAEILKKQGYATAHFGKWHVSELSTGEDTQQPQPREQGFDYSLGTENNAIPSHLNPTNFVRNGEALDTVAGYSCQIVVDEAMHWLENYHQSRQPFFIYIAFHEVHTKIASPPEMGAKYAEYDQADAEYFANVENMDHAAGRLLEKLQAMGMYENTLVFFASDNGPYRDGSQGSLRGKKSWVYDGGIRVPGIISWPAHIQESRIIDTPISLVDILPTLCEVSGASLPDKKIDGTSLLPLVHDQPWERKEPLLWFFYRTHPEVALLQDHYMLMGKAQDTIPRTHAFTSDDMDFVKNIQLIDFELYNLENDGAQTHDIGTSHPEKLRLLKTQMIQKLEDIKEEAPVWENLPKTAESSTQEKTAWSP